MPRNILLVCLTIALIFSATPGNAASDLPSVPFDSKIVDRLEVDRMYETIRFLSQSPREAGSPGENQAVAYLKNRFASYGYETQAQSFPFAHYKEPTTLSLSVSGFEDVDWSLGSFHFGVNGEVTGELVDGGIGSESDLAGKDVSGKIVLVARGVIPFADKILNAAKAGAVGVIVYNNTPGILHATLSAPDERLIPAITIGQEQGNQLVKRLASGEKATASFVVEGALTTLRTSHNVIAVRKPDTDEGTGQIVIVSAHHDTVAGSPGANDDASGIAITLELARVLADVPIDTELRFITFGAEESSLMGSFAYVESLTDAERERIVGVFQLDMVGSKDSGELMMYTADGQKNLITDMAAVASSHFSDVLHYGQEAGSDHLPFHLAGIPAGLFTHAPREPWYHSPNDTIEHISRDKIKQVAQIIGASVYEVARPDTPAIEKVYRSPVTVDYPFDDRAIEDMAQDNREQDNQAQERELPDRQVEMVP
ncbi:M28 family peptidase [Brevibacillus humidisoli]|uniref:M28 family peptidase n=1 Tax=Brevibacillus humidisoli TaxID=2895522 RepID=UPI001E2B14CF|nr:M28 family peptidase [Brevibacillus humidisoli]UFJ39019.1 M28 family peptidase [Brevibacillus humidisoli]